MAEFPKKPSFFRSTMSGIKGFVKGMFAGGAVGAITGALIGGGIAVATGGFALPALAAAGEAAWIGAILMGAVGAVSGTVTDVVRSREAAQVSAQEVVGVAKVAFAQGMAVGHQVGHVQAAEAHAATGFAERIKQERARAAQQSQQIH